MLDLFINLFLITSITFLILNFAFKRGQFTCQHYILNTYLYVILALLLVGLTLILMDKMHIRFLLHPLIMLIISLGILFALLFLPSNYVILKHILWIAFVILLGSTFYFYYLVAPDTFVSTLITTALLTIGLSILAFAKPEWISLNWGPILFWSLFAGIVLQLVLIFIGSKQSWGFRHLLSYGFIILFIFYLLYDTKRLQINALRCIKADYITESLNLFLDIINLFSNISQTRK